MGLESHRHQSSKNIAREYTRQEGERIDLCARYSLTVVVLPGEHEESGAM